MSLLVKLRRGEGPFWGPLKRLARRVLRLHVPVAGPLRYLFGFLYHAHVFVRGLLANLARFFWYEPLFRSQCAEVGPGLRLERLPFIVGTGRIVLGDGVVFGGKVDFTFGNRGERTPEVRIGNHTFLGHETTLATTDSIHIGEHCLISSGVNISDYDGHPTDPVRRRAGDPTPPENIRPIRIGDDVWIGANVKILKGVRIGNRAIVGAAAVVTRDVPADAIVAGNPARVVKQLPPPEASA